MRAAPLRFLNAAFWPLTIWSSLTHLEEHAADDYVERTSPIVASAIAFWVCLIALLVLANPVATSIGAVLEDGSEAIAVVRRSAGSIVGVLQVFTPVIYAFGLWLFTARDEAYPR
ncbi:MAG: hypothetical protein J0L81_10700 [Caulobacterales bacterium]|jgi:hypothetical protein|nr:hypothetical protein [Caulobacterales bacterium]